MTRLSLFVAGLSALGLRYYGLAQLDLVWYVSALAALVMIVLCTALVGLGALWMRRAVRPADPYASPVPSARVTDMPFETGFRLTRLRFWPLIETSSSWSSPEGARLDVRREGGQWVEHVALADHGDLRRVERRVTVRDVLGLAAITLRCSAPVHWDVLPHRGLLRDVPWLSSLAGGDDMPHPMGVAAGDRLDLRRYAPGDPGRFIHWKVYARTRKLVVRVPERALSRSHRTAAFLVAGEQDSASAAASLSAMEAGALGPDWVFGADGSELAVETPAEAEAAVRRSAAARHVGGRGLAGFLKRAAEQGPVALMLFVPPVGGDWETPVMTALRNSLHRPCVVIGVDSLHEPVSLSLWQRFALLQTPGSAPTARSVRALLARLRAAGADVWIADRMSGRLLGPAHLAAVSGAGQRDAA